MAHFFIESVLVLARYQHILTYHVDINARNHNGDTAWLARLNPEITAFLKSNGGVEIVVEDDDNNDDNDDA